MSGYKFENRKDTNLYMGQRFGRTEVIKITSNGYVLLCDCGITINKNRGATPPQFCKDCRKLSQRVWSEANSTVVRELTDKEKQMIKDFKNG